MNPYHHALSSAEKYGGEPEDYLEIHRWFDESKAFLPDFRHRALRHHAEGIFLAERIFGPTLTNSAGRVVPTRFIGEQHVKEDLGRIPTAQDWLECIAPQAWMMRSGNADKSQPASDRDSAIRPPTNASRHALSVGELIAQLQRLAEQSPLGDETSVCVSRPETDYEDLLPPILERDPDGAVVLLISACEGCGDTPGVRLNAGPSCSFEFELPAGFVIIERCDACDRFVDDLAAAKSVADHVHWIHCTAGHGHAIGLPHRKEDRNGPAQAADL